MSAPTPPHLRSAFGLEPRYTAQPSAVAIPPVAWVATEPLHADGGRALFQAGAGLNRLFDEPEADVTPGAIRFMLDTLGCLSIENPEHLRSLVLDSTDARLEPVRQRLRLRDGAAAACTPAGLEMP